MADATCIDCGVALLPGESRRCKRCWRQLQEEFDVPPKPVKGDPVDDDG